MNKAMNDDADDNFSNPPILRANQQLTDEVELLSKYVSILEDRLAPVLYSGPTEVPKENYETKAEADASSPLASFVRDQTALIRSSKTRLMGLVERLEI